MITSFIAVAIIIAISIVLIVIGRYIDTHPVFCKLPNLGLYIYGIGISITVWMCFILLLFISGWIFYFGIPH